MKTHPATTTRRWLQTLLQVLSELAWNAA